MGNIPWYMIQSLRDLIMGRKRKVDILNSFDGLLEAGEMLVVLGPPGSGCTTLLKTIAGEMNGIYLDEGAEINYRGKFDIQKSLAPRYDVMRNDAIKGNSATRDANRHLVMFASRSGCTHDNVAVTDNPRYLSQADAFPVPW